MARTKASVGAKVSSGKSSKARCSAAPPPSTASSSNGEKSRGYSGGNSVCPRETPKWQRPITNFFITNQSAQSDSEAEDTNEASASSSNTKPKRAVIESDDEEEIIKPINKELDETLELEPLTGEDSHKIDEYYITKDKGKGKKTANKENLHGNVKRNSTKREIEDVIDEENDRVAKKIKVN